MLRKLFGIAAFAAAAFGGFAGDYSVQKLAQTRENGIYKCGEEVVVTGLLLKAGKPVTEGKLRATIKWEGTKIATQELPCDGKPFRFRAKSDKPGWLYFGIEVIGKDGKAVKNPLPKQPQFTKPTTVAEIGAMYEPEKVRAAETMPADFEEFWRAERAKLDRVPVEPNLEKLDSGDPKIELYAVSIPAGVDNPATGYLALPVGAKPKSLPIFIDYQSLGPYDASRGPVINNAKRGFLALSTTWHGFPVGQTGKFYTEAIAKGIDRHRDIGDLLKWPWHCMYLRVMRSLDYMKSRPEWDGKTLIVRGGSFGGAQSIIAAAFDPAVTLAVISVPGLCDFNADLAGRKRSIPVTAYGKTKMTPEVRKALAYHDMVNLATLVNCEVYVCTGFADELCPPSNVVEVFNNMPSAKKVLYCNPRTGHYGTTPNRDGNARLAEIFRNVKINPYIDKE